MKFQVVVANPPFSLDKLGQRLPSEAEADSKGKKKMTAELDHYHRFDWVCLPRPKATTPLCCICSPAWMRKTAVWQWCCPMVSCSEGPAREKFAVSWWK